MNHSSKSIYYFSYYVLLSGIALLLFPNLIFGFLMNQSIPTEHIFIYHIVGLVATCVGFYYWHCGRTHQIEFYKATVVGRLLFFVGSILLVFLLQAPLLFSLMGLMDAIGAIWTYRALQKDGIPFKF